MLRLLKMLVLPLVAGSMIAGEGCCRLMPKLLECLKAATTLALLHGMPRPNTLVSSRSVLHLMLL